MQPVLEFVKHHSRSYTYSISAPSTGGATPVPCYVDRGHISLEACLLDAAQALSINFARFCVHYQGVCMGDIDGRQLGLFAERIAGEWMVADDRRHAKPVGAHLVA